MARETLGNNKWHDPEICKTCEGYDCTLCSNGPRGRDYRQAEAEARIRDMIYAMEF